MQHRMWLIEQKEIFIITLVWLFTRSVLYFILLLYAWKTGNKGGLILHWIVITTPQWFKIIFEQSSPLSCKAILHVNIWNKSIGEWILLFGQHIHYKWLYKKRKKNHIPAASFFFPMKISGLVEKQVTMVL